jgi:regulator of sigma E protease
MTILTIIELVAAIAVLIFVHELGHFLVARLLHVDAEEFGFGLPPRIAVLGKMGEMVISLNALPLGGFVKLKGETDAGVPGGFASSKPWVKVSVLVAGPVMNLLAAVILYAIIFARLGVPDEARLNQVYVASVSTDSPAAQAGLMPDDLILEVDGQSIQSTDMAHEIIYNNLGKTLPLLILRNNQEIGLTVTLNSQEDVDQGALALGIGMQTPTRPLKAWEALPIGFSATFDHAKNLISMFAKLIRGEIPASEGRLLGYKGMYDLYANVRGNDAEMGYPAGTNALGYFTMIAISFGMLNLLPLPALDGGRIVFALIELVTRRRLPMEYENIINFVGLILLVLVLIVVNVQDFINPVKFP